LGGETPPKLPWKLGSGGKDLVEYPEKDRVKRTGASFISFIFFIFAIFPIFPNLPRRAVFPFFRFSVLPFPRFKLRFRFSFPLFKYFLHF
jgi:hypothetical protein